MFLRLNNIYKSYLHICTHTYTQLLPFICDICWEYYFLSSCLVLPLLLKVPVLLVIWFLCCLMRPNNGWCWCPAWICSDCNKARSCLRLCASIPSLSVYMVLEFTLNSFGHLEFLWHPSMGEASSSSSWQSRSPLSVTGNASLHVGRTRMGVWAHVWTSFAVTVCLNVLMFYYPARSHCGPPPRNFSQMSLHIYFFIIGNKYQILNFIQYLSVSVEYIVWLSSKLLNNL